MKSKTPLPKGAAKTNSTKKPKTTVARKKPGLRLNTPKVKAPADNSKTVAVDPPEKHAGGRPTKYDPAMCEQAREYFNREPFTTCSRIITRKDGSTVEEQTRLPAELPTLAGLACLLKVHRDTLNQWAKDHKEFSDTIKEGKAHQERILVSNGLCGLYEGAFSIFTAKNILGWRDKLAIGGDEDNPNPVPVATNAGDFDAMKARLAQFTGAVPA
jgi:hypothetical protein